MKRQLEKSLLLEALTPACTSVAALLPTKSFANKPKQPKTLAAGNAFLSKQVSLFWGTLQETAPAYNILVALLAVHLVNGALQSKPK